ncbi:MAG: hypothetical protein ACM31K_01965 [Solirubrobacterales bacterium]
MLKNVFGRAMAAWNASDWGAQPAGDHLSSGIHQIVKGEFRDSHTAQKTAEEVSRG